MLTQPQSIRQQVWRRLRKIFNNYTNGQEIISSLQLQRVIRQILHEESPREIDYVLNNLNKIDTDSNGYIDFEQFATFLLKRHCGEIALQKMHYNNQMSHGKDRKITSGEFIQLLNSAYSFLGFSINTQQANSIFRQADSDNDGLITYVQYFTFIDQYLCRPLNKSSSPAKVTVLGGREMLSRLRKFIWDELRAIYDHYDKDRSDTLDIREFEIIAREILKETSRVDIDSLMFNLLRLNASGSVSFKEFAPFFLKYTAEIGLGRFRRLHGSQNRRISSNDFVAIVKSTFSYLPISRVNDSLLHKIFTKIDRDNDGWITNQQFMLWVELFLCPVAYYGFDFYVQEDDQTLATGQSYILTATEAKQSRNLTPPKNSAIHQTSSNTYLSALHSNMQSTNIFPSNQTVNSAASRVPTNIVQSIPRVNHMPSMTFSNHQLAIKVRKQVLLLISKFDNNNNGLFEQEQIISLLQTVLKQNKNEITYVIANVFRYDKDNDKKITYDQLTNFLLEMHSGQMAIQRLHMHGTYKRGAERMMSRSEFITTIQYALSFYDIVGHQDILDTLFNDIDRDRDGWISYQQYFEFLRFYFGSQSYVVASGIRFQYPQEANIIMTNNSLSSDQKLRQLFHLQLNLHIYKSDTNRNRLLQKSEVITLLTVVFGYSYSEVEKILANSGMFNGTNTITFNQFITFITSQHIKRYALHNYLLKYKLQKASQQLINFEEFVKIIEFSLGFTLVLPKIDHLKQSFQIIDSNRDGWISFQQFYDYITTLFSSYRKVQTSILVQNTRTNQKVHSVSSNEEGFYRQIWTELRRLYDHYDTSRANQLSFENLELFVSKLYQKVLKKNLTLQMYRFLKAVPKEDMISLQAISYHSTNSQIMFQYQAPYILNYVAETSLKRFHLQQTPGKNHLTRQQFTVVVRSAYNFLRSIRKQTDVIHLIYDRLNRDHNLQVLYDDFISWVHFEIAKKPR